MKNRVLWHLESLEGMNESESGYSKVCKMSLEIRIISHFKYFDPFILFVQNSYEDVMGSRSNNQVKI